MKANPTELARIGEAGRYWYRDAWRSAMEFAEGFPGDLRPSTGAVCDVLAVTSPRVQVRRNVELTRHYFERGSLDGVGALPTTLVALAHWERTGEVRGPKTGAFARALRLDMTAVVIDTWMARAWGYPPHHRRGLRAAERRRIERGIRSVAGRLGWYPAETQSAIWHGAQIVRGLNPAPLEFYV